MSFHPRPERPAADRRPVTLTKLAEMRALGEPIVMVTRLRPPERAGRRGGRRRHRAGRRLRRQHGARLPRHGPRHRRGAADALRAPCGAGCRRRCWSATCRSAPTRPRTPWRSRPRSASSRRRAATPSSSRAAAPRPSARGRSSAPASRSWATSGSRPRPRPRSAATAPRAARRARARRCSRTRCALQDAGCFSIVFEAIPAQVTDVIMEHMEVPVIGIGAGASTDGQVLVLHDLLGIHDGLLPQLRQALRRRSRGDGRAACAPTPRTCARARFPAQEHAYGDRAGGARPRCGTSCPGDDALARPERTRASRGGPRLGTYTAPPMARLSQLFAPREREFFDLFEEAGANIVRAAELLEQHARALARRRRAGARDPASASRRATASPTTSSSGSTRRS